ncbi:MAG TPA: response regulator [Candidatus Binatia bacterium]|nr:response regulator [Candidatus Binatia bacterium]
MLVVDDDASVRKALQRLFRSAGYPVETFASAADFLAHDVPLRGSCVVIDIRMPGISGLDLQQQLGARCPELPVVVITGHADAETRQRALDGGAVAVLYKPFDEEALLDAVTRAFAARS